VDPRRWLRRTVALALAVALVLGSSGAAPLPSASQSRASAVGHPGATASLGTSADGVSPSRGPSVAISDANPTGTPTAAAIPSQTSPTATITFNNLMLDTSAGSARAFSFISDGGGVVSAQVVATSPTDSTKLCIAVDGAQGSCSSGATPDIAVTATTAHSRWSVTLISPNESQPTVDVAFSWPTDNPSISLDHGRFGGFPNPDSLRSLTATFTTRAAGRVTVDAAWSPATLDATLTLTEVSGSGGSAVDTATYAGQSSTAPPYSHAVAVGRTYRIVLFNDSPDGVKTNLTATIAFP
jgi:hypothetical protein